MNELRERCPWDREQTFHSLRANTIEETYELTEAIDLEDMAGIKEELGDLLLHVVFYSKLGEEQGAFNFADVVADLCAKLEYRHPHIYGDVAANTTDEVRRNWEALKLRKKMRKSGILGGVPSSLPAMTKAVRIGSKAASAGFDWQAKEDVWTKVREEIEEVAAEMESLKETESLKTSVNDNAKDEAVESSDYQANKERLEGEIGDLFFALTNAARLYDVDPEAALERTNRKFISRFGDMERAAEADGKAISELSLDEMEALWCAAKSKE